MHLNWTFCAAWCLLGGVFSQCSQLFPHTLYRVDLRHLRPLPILGEPQRFRWGVQVKPQYQWYIWTEHSVQPGVCLASSFPTALSSWEWGKAPGWPHQQTQSCFFSSNSWVRMSIRRALYSVDLRHLHQGFSRGGCLILHFEWMNELSSFFFFSSFFFSLFFSSSFFVVCCSIICANIRDSASMLFIPASSMTCSAGGDGHSFLKSLQSGSEEMLSLL